MTKTLSKSSEEHSKQVTLMLSWFTFSFFVYKRGYL